MKNNETGVFTCSRDKFSRFITFLLFVFAVTLIILSQTRLLSTEDGNGLAGIISGTGIFILLLFTYGYSPTAYVIQKKDIVIKRPFRDKLISSTDIKQLRKPAEKEISWPLRKFGNGGAFGYTGIYYTKHIGNMQWYCSRRSHYVIIERKSSRPVVITPDDPDGFIHAFCK